MISIINFVSRHSTTPAQKATMALEGFEEIRNVSDVVFDINSPARPQLVRAGVATNVPIGVVAPSWFLRRLLLEGVPCIYEFVNEPSARQRGIFICKGVVKHTLTDVEFIPCPVPVSEQEEQAIR